MLFFFAFSCACFFSLVPFVFLWCRATICFLLLSFSISCVSVRTYGNVTARKVSHCRTKQKLFTSFVFTLLLISSFSLQLSFHIKCSKIILKKIFEWLTIEKENSFRSSYLYFFKQYDIFFSFFC